MKEVFSIVKYCNEYDLFFFVRGVGIGLSGGVIFFNNEVVISLVKMKCFFSVDYENRCVVVELGFINFKLINLIFEKGYYYVLDFLS